MKILIMAGVAIGLLLTATLRADDLATRVKADYDTYLWPLFEYFHRNLELSTIETCVTSSHMGQLSPFH